MAKSLQSYPDPEAEEAQSRMTFGDHLEELRKRIIRALAGSSVGVILGLIYMKQIVLFVVRPYRLALLANHQPEVFTNSKPTEVILTNMSVGIQAGLILTSPWIIYQIWSFVAAGLYKRERKIVYRYVGPSAVLFLLGVAFFYFFVLPLTLRFFVHFTADTAGPPLIPSARERMLMGLPAGAASQPAAATQPMTIPVLAVDPSAPPTGEVAIYYNEGKVKIREGDQIISLLYVPEGSLFTNFLSLRDYLSFVTLTTLVFGLAFELPMVIMILAQIGIVETQTFRNIRKYAYFALAVLSAIAAPSPDPTMMIALMLPLVLLYELGIVLAAIVVRRQEKSAEEA